MTKTVFTPSWNITPRPWSFSLSDNVELIPSIHHSLVTAALTYQVLTELQPETLFLEMPEGTESLLYEAADFFPLPVLLYNKNSFEYVDELGKEIPTDFYVIHPGDAVGISVYWSRTHKSEMICVDNPILEQGQTKKFFLNDPLQLTLLGFEKILRLFEGKDMNDPRAEHMRSKILQSVHAKSAWVGGLFHVPTILESGKKHPPSDIQFENEIEWELGVVHPFSYPHLIVDPPFFVASFWMQREQFRHHETLIDLLRQAKVVYAEKFDEEIGLGLLKRLIQYARNLALLDGRVFPSLFNIVEAAKGSVDDDFALEVYREAVKYPFYPEKIGSEINGAPVIDFGSILHPRHHLSITLKPRHARPVLSKNPRNKEIWDLIDAPPEEEFPGEWEQQWNSKHGYYSYPPEDDYLERFLNHARKKLQQILLEEKSRTEPFRTSLLDGIDWKETIRNAYKKEIYVREIPKKGVFINTIIMQFTRDDRPYTNTMTWYAEHLKESNLSLVSSEPGDLIVGPGIGRAKYAGFFSVYPPLWWVEQISKDPTEPFLYRLIQAAVRSSPSRIIGIIGVERPSLAMRSWAGKRGIRLVYLPLSAFSRETIKRIRVFHVFRDKDTRSRGRRYIGY